jgi:hypothetical protein
VLVAGARQNAYASPSLTIRCSTSCSKV